MDKQLRELEKKAAGGDLEAQAALGREVLRAIDVLKLVNGLPDGAKIVIGGSVLADKLESDIQATVTEAAVARIVGNVDLGTLAESVAEHITASDVAEHVEIDYSDFEIDYSDLANEVDTSDIASEIDLNDLAGHIDISELEISAEQVAEHIDLSDLAEHVDLDSAAEDLVETLAERISPEAVAEHLVDAVAKRVSESINFAEVLNLKTLAKIAKLVVKLQNGEDLDE